MIAKLLYRWSGNLPCRLIHRKNNERYLERYWLGQWFGITFYLHRFVSGEGDEHVHDHPFKWAAALVLAGGYVEEVVRWPDPSSGWLSRIRNLRPGWVNLIGPNTFHQITETRPETWTLFMHGERVKGWGLLFKGDALVYMQPYDVDRTRDWQLTALIGNLEDRADFNPYG